MSLTTRRLEMGMSDEGVLEPTDVYYIDFSQLSDEQIANMRNHKAQLIRNYRKLAKRRIGLRCQNTGKPVKQISHKSFVEYMLSSAFPYETPNKR